MYLTHSCEKNHFVFVPQFCALGVCEPQIHLYPVLRWPVGPELLCVLRSWASCDQQWTCCLCLLQGPAAGVCGSAGPPSTHCQPRASLWRSLPLPGVPCYLRDSGGRTLSRCVFPVCEILTFKNPQPAVGAGPCCTETPRCPWRLAVSCDPE